MATPRRWLPGGTAWASTATDAELTRLARLLFPHAAIPDEVYAQVAGTVFQNFAAQAATAGLFDAAEAALDAELDGSWFDADEEAQIRALHKIQGEAFFAAIVGGLRGGFYYHPAVWQHLGYPGSSIEHGGYRNRGFNDIDWLPEVN